MDFKKIGLATALKEVADKIQKLEKYIQLEEGIVMFDEISSELDEIIKEVER